MGRCWEKSDWRIVCDFEAKCRKHLENVLSWLHQTAASHALVLIPIATRLLRDDPGATHRNLNFIRQVGWHGHGSLHWDVLLTCLSFFFVVTLCKGIIFSVPLEGSMSTTLTGHGAPQWDDILTSLHFLLRYILKVSPSVSLKDDMLTTCPCEGLWLCNISLVLGLRVVNVWWASWMKLTGCNYWWLFNATKKEMETFTCC